MALEVWDRGYTLGAPHGASAKQPRSRWARPPHNRGTSGFMRTATTTQPAFEARTSPSSSNKGRSSWAARGVVDEIVNQVGAGVPLKNESSGYSPPPRSGGEGSWKVRSTRKKEDGMNRRGAPQRQGGAPFAVCLSTLPPRPGKNGKRSIPLNGAHVNDLMGGGASPYSRGAILQDRQTCPHDGPHRRMKRKNKEESGQDRGQGIGLGRSTRTAGFRRGQASHLSTSKGRGKVRPWRSPPWAPREGRGRRKAARRASRDTHKSFSIPGHEGLTSRVGGDVRRTASPARSSW